MTKTVIKVGMASCGIAAGARPVYEYLLDKLGDR
ncbi:MAG TPA: ferredoxin, partial [Thermovirga lienii]|nr:ferredoxin [Thermovirga lienii]